MDDINELPFKLRFTSTEKLCKEVIKLVHERYDAYDKLCAEYENIGEHKLILGNIKSDLQTSHDALKQLRALCQCQSDDDKNTANKQLANNEEMLTKLENKFNGIATIKMVDISVKRLPSNWRAAMLKIARDKSKNEMIVDSVIDDSDQKLENNGEITTNGGGDQTKIEIENNNDNNNQNFDDTISKEEEVITEQFEMDLERKIYETQVEELMAMVQMLIMRIKTIKARIDISKQLIKVAIKLKREYEASNSKLKETMATCHCAEAGADDDVEFQKKMEEKKCLEETVERTSNDLKYWEEQYSILKEGRNAKKEEPTAMEVPAPATTTVVVAHEEMEEDLPAIASTSSQQSCMYAPNSQSNSSSQQGTANPAVIYLEGLVAHQQPTYIPAANLHQPLSMYQHYPIGHPHHSYHQAPDGSIQVYSSDISTHPGYIAYQ